MNKNVKIYVVLRLCVNISAQMLTATVAYQIYQITHSTTFLALSGLMQFLPKIIFMIWSGTIADKFNRIKIARVTQSLILLTSLLFAVLTVLGLLSPYLCLLLVFVYGTIFAMEGPAVIAILPNIVKKKNLSRAQSAVSSLQQISLACAPALAGSLIAFNQIASYLAICISSLIAFLVSFLLKTNSENIDSNQVSAKYDSPLDGFRFIWKHKGILGALSLDMFAVLFGGVVALLPVYASDVLHVGAVGYGVLRGATSAGAILMAVCLTIFPIKKFAGKKMFFCVAVFGAVTIAIAFSKSLVITVILLMILGVVDQVSVVIRSVFVQLNTPDEVRGRVSAVNLIFIGASNQLGEFESGMVASAFAMLPGVTIGAIPATIFGGVCTLIIVVIWYAKFSQLRELDSLG